MLENNCFNDMNIEVDLNKTTMANVMKLFNPEEIQDITISSTPLEEIIKDIYKKVSKEAFYLEILDMMKEL